VKLKASSLKKIVKSDIALAVEPRRKVDDLLTSKQKRDCDYWFIDTQDKGML
jgi:hypothetical protein